MSKSLITGLIFLAAVLVLGLLVWPNYQQLATLQGQEKSIQDQLDQRNAQLQNMRDVLANLESDQATIQKIDAAIPSYADFDQLLNLLSTSANSSGLLLSELSAVSVVALAPAAPGQVATFSNRLKDIRFSVKLTGTYPALKSFVQQVERSARLIEVERLAIVPPQSTGLQVLSALGQSYRFELGLKVHSY